MLSVPVRIVCLLPHHCQVGLLPCWGAPTLCCSMRLSGLACCLAVMRHSALMHEAAKHSLLLGCAHFILLLQALLTTSACDGGQLLKQPPWDKQPLQTIQQSTRLPLPQVSHFTIQAAPQLSVLPQGRLLLSVNGASMCRCLAAWDPAFKHLRLSHAMVAGPVVGHNPLY